MNTIAACFQGSTESVPDKVCAAKPVRIYARPIRIYGRPIRIYAQA